MWWLRRSLGETGGRLLGIAPGRATIQDWRCMYYSAMYGVSAIPPSTVGPLILHLSRWKSVSRQVAMLHLRRYSVQGSVTRKKDAYWSRPLR